jgi:ABC-type glycerol-3-phosphate transport system permease component
MVAGDITGSLGAGQVDEEVWHPRRGIRWWVVARHAVLIAFCLSIILPILWVILLSIKSLPDGAHRWIWPKHWAVPIYQHYNWILTQRRDIISNVRNSVLVTTLTVIASTITAVLAGYALVHLRTPLRKFIMMGLVASLFFPTRVTALLGIYNVQDRLGLINKTWSLMLPYTALTVALSAFIMRGVFEQVPKEIVDSSRVDGASALRTLLGIMLPLVRNGIVVVIIVNFVAAWGEFLLALTLMNDASRRTLPVFIATAAGGVGPFLWPRMAALYILAITPGFVAFAISQRWYMRGLQEGALKT